MGDAHLKLNLVIVDEKVVDDERKLGSIRPTIDCYVVIFLGCRLLEGFYILLGSS